MVMIEDKELAQLFKAESAEHLARLDDGLLRLEKTPADQPLLEEVFRESHSLKGAARVCSLPCTRGVRGEGWGGGEVRIKNYA